MAISTFELFSIGIGPSSSHTVGPMRAALRFVQQLESESLLSQTSEVIVQLYGSLGATGKGHGSDKAVLGGLVGHAPESVDPEELNSITESVAATGNIHLLGTHEIAFDLKEHLQFSGVVLDFHSNGLRITAKDSAGQTLLERTYYSVGGGFVVDEEADGTDRIVPDTTKVKYPFTSGAELLAICESEGLCISTVMLENEKSWRSESEIRSGLLKIWSAMQTCVENGCRNEGILPGGLKVKRRAAHMHRKLNAEHSDSGAPRSRMDWVNLWALAVNEENAAGGRVVTAPTNGAAGIIPSVMHYYGRFCHGANDDGMVRFLLTAAAIGTLFKINASISGAEVGCQGEVGSACSMAAGGLAEVFGGTPAQVENAAEIGMEHNLGLTCDPIGGLVQVPCIERNAMGAVKAINAARLAMRGDGKHFVSLDKVIKTMRETGKDMQSKYKETARGGLAVNVIEC
ncbi:L-serine ammonia-lyase [Mariniblastus fucicola]|uniref:L-serine dehydratase n=1 Tax=Mariniblastus fucicola TaxID=980251 RepID=A0A5B9PKN5_9BACT|nr:L-serine ammonia-lyase [Mariniblastus fucicola]QEG25266.1 L-serine dehydratase TdcG [Mariniblastus fucicola]